LKEPPVIGDSYSLKKTQNFNRDPFSRK